jgi:DNA-binding SARP family transcriptional activator/tetratricopeptide (TPR) repeat protein
LEFGLLGDVEVRADGRAVEIGHVRQRCVLVALLAEESRPVPVDRLLDRVWGERAPQRARDTLYGYLSKLRRLLGVDIERQPGGYLLAVDPDSVDLHRFRSLVRQARDSDDEHAVALLDDALALWRGEALAGLDSPWFDALRDALHAERVAAELDRNDVALRCGRHAAVLPDLRVAVAQRPLDERLAAQLMLALHHGGNSSESLRHYDQVRRHLADELGADPGAPLRELHQRILTADPRLVAESAVESAVRSRPVPRQLPAAQRWFTGRADELAALTAAEPAGTVLITAIGGTGGIGKTALAVHWAHQHLDDFPDGQLYVNLRGFDPSGDPVAPTVAVRGFLEALGEDPDAIPASLAAQTGRYRSLVSGKRLLVVLDNARDTEQVIPLLPGSPSCAVLVTSRLRLPGLLTAHGARSISLDVLGDREAREFLTSRLGAARVAAEPDVVTALVGWCGGLPLALSIVAARAAMDPDFPLAVLADELRECSDRLDALDAGELGASLRAVFSWSRHALSPEAAEVFTLLGLAPSADISLPAIASLTALSTARARVLLRDLENAHLVQQHVPGRYRMHDLVGLYAADQVARSGNDAALRRLVGFHLGTARAGALVLEPHKPLPELADIEGCHPQEFADAAAAMRWFDEEHESLLALQRVAAGRGWDEIAWLLARTMNNYHLRRGRTADDVAAWQVGLSAAERLGDPVKQATAHTCLGVNHIELSSSELGHEHLRRSLDLHEDGDDHAARANAHRAIAWASEFEGDFERALTHALSALEGFRKADFPIREAEALNEVGWRYACLGRYAEAKEYCDEGMALNRRLGHKEGEAATLDSLAHIAHHDGRHADAVAHYHEALALYRELDNSYEEASVLHHLGDVHAALGRREEARELWDKALALYRVQGRANDVASISDQLAGLDGAV